MTGGPDYSPDLIGSTNGKDQGDQSRRAAQAGRSLSSTPRASGKVDIDRGSPTVRRGASGNRRNPRFASKRGNAGRRKSVRSSTSIQNLTDAEKSEAVTYSAQSGSIVQFHQNVKGGLQKRRSLSRRGGSWKRGSSRVSFEWAASRHYLSTLRRIGLRSTA